MKVVRTEPAAPRDAGLVVAWATADTPDATAAVLLQLGTERWLLDVEAARSTAASLIAVADIVEAGATPPPETLVRADAPIEAMDESYRRTHRQA